MTKRIGRDIFGEVMGELLSLGLKYDFSLRLANQIKGHLTIYDTEKNVKLVCKNAYNEVLQECEAGLHDDIDSIKPF